MNQTPAQNLGGQQNGGAGMARQGIQLYRPEMMRTMPGLSQDERIKYERGLATLWRVHDSLVPGSTEQVEAVKKISEFGKMLANKLQQRQMMQNQQQRQQQQMTPQQQQQIAAQQQQLQQQQQMQQQAQQQMTPQQQQQQQQLQALQQQRAQQQAQQAAQQQAQQQATNGGQASQGQPNQSGAPVNGQGGAQTQQRSLPPHIVSHVNEMNFIVPPDSVGKTTIQEIKTQYIRALTTMETARSMNKAIAVQLENPSLSPEAKAELERRKVHVTKQYQDSITFANQVRSRYSRSTASPNGTAAATTAGNQGRPQGPGAAQTGAGVGAGGGVASASAMQPAAAAVSAAIEAAKNQQSAAGRMAAGSVSVQATQPNSQHLRVQTPATPVQSQQPPSSQAPSTQQQPQQVVSLQQPQQQQQGQQQGQQQQQQQPQQQQQQAAIKVESGTQQPAQIPAPLNTALAAGASGMQSAGTPTQNSARVLTPQSTTPTTSNSNVRPLTHAAAVNLAGQRPSTVPGAAGNTPSSGPISTPGVIGAAQTGHPHAHPSQQAQQQPQQQQAAAQSTIQSKLPIPKHLPERATAMPAPVTQIGGIGSGRPTLSGGSAIAGGVMNQPALLKAPAYTIEGEGERILNKKKLDELVRQVCGGTAEGQEGNMLTPEVEEVGFTVTFFFSIGSMNANTLMLLVCPQPG